MHNLPVNPETTSECCIFFVWPLDIVHVIDKTSPLYDMTEADFATDSFEIILVMEGMNETSNMIFQARYLIIQGQAIGDFKKTCWKKV